MSKPAVWAVVLHHVQHSKVESIWATKALAERRIFSIIADMPKASRTSWKLKPKTDSQDDHCGRIYGVWACSMFGPSTRQISTICLKRMVIGQGEVVQRLADLAPRKAGH